jgi:hypothetical protein
MTMARMVVWKARTISMASSSAAGMTSRNWISLFNALHEGCKIHLGQRQEIHGIIPKYSLGLVQYLSAHSAMSHFDFRIFGGLMNSAKRRGC